MKKLQQERGFKELFVRGLGAVRRRHISSQYFSCHPLGQRETFDLVSVGVHEAPKFHVKNVTHIVTFS